ncbi:MAG TPA: hypothetical protein PKL40_10230, partial [Methanoregulaceae archaeon]|nr:hypothetical protein [Methanoregulaceae archaeon]
AVAGFVPIGVTYVILDDITKGHNHVVVQQGIRTQGTDQALEENRNRFSCVSMLSHQTPFFSVQGIHFSTRKRVIQGQTGASYQGRRPDR